MQNKDLFNSRSFSAAVLADVRFILCSPKSRDCHLTTALADLYKLLGVALSKLKSTAESMLCIHNWRASVASETLTGVTQLKIGDVCLFIYLFVYMFGRTYVILYFDPRVFVLVMWSTPYQIALNRILWFIDQYPYHPRN